LLAISSLSISCVTTFTSSDMNFIKWENTDPIYTFDKQLRILKEQDSFDDIFNAYVF
jgi:hypothetical protein